MNDWLGARPLFVLALMTTLGCSHPGRGGSDGDGDGDDDDLVIDAGGDGEDPGDRSDWCGIGDRAILTLSVEPEGITRRVEVELLYPESISLPPSLVSDRMRTLVPADLDRAEDHSWDRELDLTIVSRVQFAGGPLLDIDFDCRPTASQPAAEDFRCRAIARNAHQDDVEATCTLE